MKFKTCFWWLPWHTVWDLKKLEKIFMVNITYLPRWRVSPRNMFVSTTAMTIPSGLKIATYRGPFMRKHQVWTPILNKLRNTAWNHFLQSSNLNQLIHSTFSLTKKKTKTKRNYSKQSSETIQFGGNTIKLWAEWCWVPLL